MFDIVPSLEEIKRYHQVVEDGNHLCKVLAVHIRRSNYGFNDVCDDLFSPTIS